MSAPSADPLTRFRDRFAEAQARETVDPTAAALATATADGRPSVRIVLVKECDPRGFRFFTNLGSRKARELAANPHAALCFHWPILGEQVRAEGVVERLSDGDCDAYFAARPRVSQLGAWASRQSEVLARRDELLARLEEIGARFPDAVPRPPFWGGYRLLPDAIEFWRAAEFRLHERELFRRGADGWALDALYP